MYMHDRICLRFAATVLLFYSYACSFLQNEPQTVIHKQVAMSQLPGELVEVVSLESCD